MSQTDIFEKVHFFDRLRRNGLQLTKNECLHSNDVIHAKKIKIND